MHACSLLLRCARDKVQARHRLPQQNVRAPTAQAVGPTLLQALSHEICLLLSRSCASVQAALRRARAPAHALGPWAGFAGAPTASSAGAPAADAPVQAVAEAPTVYVTTNVAVQTGLAPGDAPFGAGAPAAIGFLPLLGGYPGPEPEPTPQVIPDAQS